MSGGTPVVRPAVVIIGCGATKLDHPAPARDLYIGSMFTLAARAAEALNPSNGWYILSALYGIVHPDFVLKPYNVRMGDRRSATVANLRKQALALGIVPAGGPVMVLAGRDYAAAARSVWPAARVPAEELPAGRRGMGYQRSLYARITRTGTIDQPAAVRA